MSDLNLYEKVNSVVSGDKPMNGHALRNKQNIETLKQAQKELTRELGLSQSLQIMLEEFPKKSVLNAWSILIRNAENMDDIKDALDEAKSFEKIKEASTITDATSITQRLHTLVDDINEFLGLAMHEDSEAGTMLSEKEQSRAIKLSLAIDGVQKDLQMLIVSRSV